MHDNTRVIRTACALGDTSNCGLCIHVKDGKIIKITPGDSPGPIKRNPCVRGLTVHHWAYHADRLKHPLKRAGERGEGKWERISWDQALDELATRLLEIGKKYGPESVAWSPADFPLLRQGGFLRLLSLTKGTWIDNLSLGDIAGPNADLATFGWALGTWYTGFLVQDLNPKLAILWGANPADTDPFTMRVITESRKKGCRIVTIDPRFTTTASRSDEYLPIRPGTDGELALGMMHVILEKGLEDRTFITESTVGPLLVRMDNHLYLRPEDLGQESDGKSFMIWDRVKERVQPWDEPRIKSELLGEYSIEGITCKPAFQLLVDLVKEYPPERASEITDVPVETIQRLAVEYATRKPAALHRGWGVARTFYGDLLARALNALAAITGNVNTQRPAAFKLNRRGFLMPDGPYKRLPCMMLYDAITKGDPYSIKALCFSWRNFVDQSPNRKRVIQELIPALELILVCDLFMTNTGKYADYVLPVSSFLECTDLTESLACRFPYLQLQQKAIEPLYESKSDFRIACELGRRMGFAEYFNRSEEDFIREVLDSSHPTMEEITLEKLREGPVPAKSIEMPPARFKTPSGRIEFYVEALNSFGQALPLHTEPIEVGCEETTSGLTLLTPHPKYRHHSTGGNVPELLKFDPEPILDIHPLDAKNRNIGDGDVVLVRNARGHMKLKAGVTEHIKPGVVSVSEGWTPEQYMEGHHNELISERMNPAQNAVMGSNAAFYDVRVEVERAE